jgi:hypothetical protein
MASLIYASTSGRVLRVDYTDKSRAVRKGGSLDATDFHYYVASNAEAEHVQVLVTGTVFHVIAHRFNATSREIVDDIASDMGIVRIIQSVDRGIDWDTDFNSFPDSFLQIRSGEFEEMLKVRERATSEIRDYISKRLYAAWSHGRGTIEDAILFNRVDAMYLGIEERHLYRVIDLYEGDLWDAHANRPFLTARKELIRDLERRMDTPPSVDIHSQQGTRPQQPKYDVALSFAGEDREYVNQVAEALRAKGVKVFYDDYEQADLWGKNLYEHLTDVYQTQARYTVMFISVHYARKLWTRHERRAAQARALNEHREYVLPARFDDTEIEGLLPTVGYVDLRSATPEELANLVVRKLASKPG